MPKPKSASNIRITGSGKKSRRPSNFVPDNQIALRAWRIKLIQAAWQRTVARQMETINQ